MDEFRERVDQVEKQLEIRCLKSETDERIVELMNQLQNVHQSVRSINTNFEKNKIRVEQKLEDLGDKGRGRTESILKLEKLMEEFDGKILKSRQAAAGQSNSRKKTPDKVRNEGEGLTQEVVDEIDEEIKLLQKDLQALTS